MGATVDIIIGGIIVLVVLALLGGMGGSKQTRSSGSSTGSGRAISSRQAVLDANMPWLRERWHAAETEEKSGTYKLFPKWYFDDASDRQRDRLARDGLRLSSGASKGQHSDAIGLFEPPEPEALEILKFFDIALKGPLRNETRARHEVAKILADPEKQRAWLARPAEPLQREFYRFIETKPPAGLTFEQAENKMREVLPTLKEQQQDEWADFSNIVEEFDDREFRADVEIKKPSPTDIRTAMAALKAEGKAADDPYEIADKLRSLKPSLSRQGST